MSVCKHRPDPGSLLVPCARREWIPDIGVQEWTCVCASEVAADVAAEENRQARIPDSARLEAS